jgi:prolyl oligopeptidase
MTLFGCSMKYAKLAYPATQGTAVVDTLHGVAVPDPFRWLEEDKDPRVKSWTAQEESLARAFLDKLPQRKVLVKRFNQLWRYNDESTPQEVLDGERLFYYVKKKDWERQAYYTKEREGAEGAMLLDPNQWGKKTLDFAMPSRDGRYLVYGTAEGGNEQTKIKVMEVATKRALPDTLQGWRQGGVSWFPDHSGFYYQANPLKGEVPPGEEEYWFTVWLHKLGTPASEDKKVFYHDQVKEYFHNAEVTEDGKYVLLNRGMFNRNEVYLQKLGSEGPLTPIATGMDAQYAVSEIEGRLVIWTDKDAPRGKVYITDVDRPERRHWKELIPETEDNLQSVTGIAGRLYATYSHNAYTVIKTFTLEGKYLRDLPLPGIGSATVSGFWRKPTVWVYFTSFACPPTTYQYDFTGNTLKLYHRTPIEIDVSRMEVEQVWYPSKDGTKVSMFLIHNKNLSRDGNNPVYLTGYGGFNLPYPITFTTVKVIWAQAGGMIAIPNLRGGGEYGQEWHKAGMLERKQDVFNDFIAAAEWLIQNRYTRPEKLVIGGGSKGGLLVGAALVQRPSLFRAVYCGVPLLDMIRYHKFGYANIWAEELGSSEDPEQFKYLLKYSPYHNVKEGAKYPAVLFAASENDARCNPLHAMKMAARLQAADPKGWPILLLVQKKSGHGGGTQLSELIEQQADAWAFLMSAVGLRPKVK